MKHFFKTLTIAAIASLSLTSCEKITGEGPIISQDRNYTGFESVSVNISGRVIHTTGNDYRVLIHAQQNILDIIQTKMEGEELIIKFKEGKNVRSHEEIIVELTSPVLKAAHLAGSADMRIENELQQSQLSMSLSGSGNIVATKVTLTGQLRASISGSGNITINEGTANDSWLRITGSGNIYVDAVNNNSAYAEISGSGNIRVKASQALEARIQGSGSVLYRGTPQVTSNVSGSGSVRPL